MTHRYSHVPRFSYEFYEHQRDSFDPKAIKMARALDAHEPLTDRLWRDIMSLHRRILNNIAELRMARAFCGKGYLHSVPHPCGGTISHSWDEIDIATHQEYLCSNIQLLRKTWQKLHAADAKISAQT